MDGPLIERAVVASKNRDKAAEMETLLLREGVAGEIAAGLDWPEVIEDQPTLQGNALLKAAAAARATGLPAVADDTGLEVEALGGAPGVYTARFAGPGADYRTNMEALLGALRGVEERTARFRTVAAVIFPDGSRAVAEGELRGAIARAPRGEGGFGYDPIFEVEGRTLAELGEEEKNRISHRARAVAALGRVLRSAG